MDSFDERVAAWDVAARSGDRQEAIAPSRNRPEGYDESGKAHARMLLDVVDDPAACDVLDFGCGDGRVTCHLAGEFRTVFGCDSSAAMLDALAVRCGSVLPVLWDGRPPPPMVDAVDVACSFLVLLHYPQADGELIVRQLARVVRPGGLVAVQVPLYDVARRPPGWTSVGCWTPRQLVSAAEGAGLRVEALAANRGRWRAGRSGPNHGALHLLRRPV